MPKKQKAGKNAKNSNSITEKTNTKIVEADLYGQVYGMVEKALGDLFFNVNCFDNKIRRCKARYKVGRKRIKIAQGDCVIVALRDFDDDNADIIYKYEQSDVRQLQKDGILPKSEVIGKSNDDGDGCVEEEEAFVFEDI